MATPVITHAKVSSGTVNSNVEVDLHDWNNTHVVTGLENVPNVDTTNASNLTSGTVPAARMPALTGDVTTSAGAVATTLATVNANVGTFGSATQTGQVTFNAKGLATAVSNVTVTPAVGSITGLGSGVATLLGTFSSANLRAAITDETGTGAAVFANSPALVTPTGIVKGDVGLGNVDNTSDLTKWAATKTLTNTTLDSAGTGNVLQVSGVTVSRGQYPGINSNGSATAGNIGEIVSSSIPSGSAVSLTTGTAANITSISLTAGQWLVFGNVSFQPAGTTTQSANLAWISTTSATLPTIPNGGAYSQFSVNVGAGLTVVLQAGMTILQLNSTTTVYLSGLANFAVSTETAYGFIAATRLR